MSLTQLIRHNSVEIEDVKVEFMGFDEDFKHGLLIQTEAFLDSNLSSNLCSIEYHKGIFSVYEKMAGHIEF